MKSIHQTVCVQALQKFYCKDGESTIEDTQARIAKALAAVEDNPGKWEPVFLDAMQKGMVLAGRGHGAAGTKLMHLPHTQLFVPASDTAAGIDVEARSGNNYLLEYAFKMGDYSSTEDLSSINPRKARLSGDDPKSGGVVSWMTARQEQCDENRAAGLDVGAEIAILTVNHPDIVEFIQSKDRKGALEGFHLCVAATDAFMQAVVDDSAISLRHSMPPGGLGEQDRTVQQTDGQYIYETVQARDVWEQVMARAYDQDEPSVLFADRVSERYDPDYEASGTCKLCTDQDPLPCGHCAIGCIDLTRFVKYPFEASACFDFEAFGSAVHTSVRMLDNVLDATTWPSGQQREESLSKRRVSLGFLGLGSALVMLGERYDSAEGRLTARNIASVLRDRSYTASIELAIERGAYPSFNAENYLDSAAVRNLDRKLLAAIGEYGIRNSHLTTMVATDTVSLAYADNASRGCHPVSSWVEDRRIGEHESCCVRDHAYRMWKRHTGHQGERDEDLISTLPPAFVTAGEITADDRFRMAAEVQQFVDDSVSEVVEIPPKYPRSDFEELFTWGWKNGVLSLSTRRSTNVERRIVSDPASCDQSARSHHLDMSDPDRRIVLQKPHTPTLDSLRWRGRPNLPNGNNSKCYRVKHPKGANFALFVGEIDSMPFEVWVNAVEAPRGLEALAINLSYDMYAKDRAWLKKKLISLMRCGSEGEGFPLKMPPDGETRYAPSMVAAMAMLIDYRCTELGAFDGVKPNLDSERDTPVLDALMSPKEPKACPDGTLSWTVDVLNRATGDDFVLGLKEAVIAVDGAQQTRPYSIWLSNAYPRALDGLCKALSLDMRVVDPNWIGMKLRELLNFAEPKGDFWAPMPGTEKQQVYPSTVAYIARLVIHRFAMLGLLTDEGYPV